MLYKEFISLKDLRLCEKSKRISIEEIKKFSKLIYDMKLLCKKYNLTGLAAPQVGENVSICIIKMEKGDFEVLINPTIIHKSKEKKRKLEGCASIKRNCGLVKRYTEVRVKYYNTEGYLVEKSFKNKESRRVQHEIDHLNGILFIDKTRISTKEIKNIPEYLFAIVVIIFRIIFPLWWISIGVRNIMCRLSPRKTRISNFFIIESSENKICQCTNSKGLLMIVNNNYYENHNKLLKTMITDIKNISISNEYKNQIFKTKTNKIIYKIISRYLKNVEIEKINKCVLNVPQPLEKLELINTRTLLVNFINIKFWQFVLRKESVCEYKIKFK